MAAPDSVRKLVARFEENRQSYQAAGYNETRLRREFLDPFFNRLFNRRSKLSAEIAAARTPDVKTRLLRQIDATDAQIDLFVYEIYELTDKEIALVEEATER